MQQGIGEAADAEPLGPDAMAGADDDQAGSTAFGVGRRVEQAVGDRLRPSHVAFGRHASGHPGQSVLEPFVALRLEFGVERVIRGVHVEGRGVARQHRDQIKGCPRRTGKGGSQIHPVNTALTRPVADDVPHGS